MENIPAHIYDWIEHIPYEVLTAEQKQEVLQHLDKVEYTQLHLAAAEARQFFATQPEAKITNVFVALTDRFDEKYGKKNMPILLPLRLWQAAAAILLLAVGYMGFLLVNNPPTNKGTQTVLQRDTVYIENQLPAKEVKVYDTIFIKQPAVGREKKSNTTLADSFATTDFGTYTGTFDGLGTLSITDKDAPQNAIKNQSIEGDTFIREFGFVTL
ncbi:MAG: hypothetical protein F9K23_10805 [Bacteroidetes bacterium]|nr:MAG: hypothetical protein F9K23_10805 [Bacteroidota bacterium]